MTSPVYGQTTPERKSTTDAPTIAENSVLAAQGGEESGPNATSPWSKHSKERLFVSVFESWTLILSGDEESNLKGLSTSRRGVEELLPPPRAFASHTKSAVTHANRTVAKGWLWGGKEW